MSATDYEDVHPREVSAIIVALAPRLVARFDATADGQLLLTQPAKDHRLREILNDVGSKLADASANQSSMSDRILAYADVLQSNLQPLGLVTDGEYTPTRVKNLIGQGLSGPNRTPDFIGLAKTEFARRAARTKAINRMANIAAGDFGYKAKAKPEGAAVSGRFGLAEYNYGGGKTSRKGGQASIPTGKPAPNRNPTAGQQLGPVRTGGEIVQTNDETAHYIPTMPRVSNVVSSEGPCLYEQKVTQGDRGYWQWKCERSELPAVKKCVLHRVEDKRLAVVPVNCLQEYVNVLKGFDVDKSRYTDTDSGASLVSETVTPIVDSYGSARVTGTAGRPIPYTRLDRVGEPDDANPLTKVRPGSWSLQTPGMTNLGGGTAIRQGGAKLPETKPAAAKPTVLPTVVSKPVVPTMTKPVSAVKPVVSAVRKAGSATSTKSAGTVTAGTVNAGAVNLPSRSSVRHHNWQLTDQDLDDAELNLPRDITEMPAEWQELKALPEDQIAFYTADEYGSMRSSARQNGFDFSFRYMPFEYLREQAYLEWLVSLDYNLRAHFADYHFHKFDPVFSTIATVESYILTTLGRLEALGKYFDREALFAGAAPHRNIMHRYLRVYAFAPKTTTWISPISARYIQVPDVGAEGYRQSEAQALGNLRDLNDMVGEYANGNAVGQADGTIKIPLKYKRIGRTASFWQDVEGSAVGAYTMSTPSDLGSNEALGLYDNRVVGIVEDELLSMLARLQYNLGYVINSNASAFAFEISDAEDGLMDLQQSKYLTRELNRYLATFQLDDVEKLFHRLPQLRMAQARQEGIPLPKSTIGAYEAQWPHDVTKAAFPIGLASRPVLPLVSRKRRVTKAKRTRAKSGSRR